MQGGEVHFLQQHRGVIELFHQILVLLELLEVNELPEDRLVVLDSPAYVQQNRSLQLLVVPVDLVHVVPVLAGALLNEEIKLHLTLKQILFNLLF